MIEEPKRRGARLGLILTNKERVTGDIKVESSFACNDQEIVVSRILRAKSKITTPDFRRTAFGLSRDLLQREALLKALEGIRSKKTG